MYTPQRLPPVLTADGRALADYVERELLQIAKQFYDFELIGFQVLHVAPEKPREGQVAFADGTNWDPGAAGRGLVTYVNGAWVKP